jgi:hypothetical protein
VEAMWIEEHRRHIARPARCPGLDRARRTGPLPDQRPQTNGKIQRFHRTLADGWAYTRFYESTHHRNAALPH